MGGSQNRPSSNTTTVGQIGRNNKDHYPKKNETELKSFLGGYNTSRNTFKICQQTQRHNANY